MSKRHLCAVFFAVSLGGARGADLSATLAAERTKLLAGSRTQVAVMLTLRAPAASREVEPTSVALALVMDRSGSMKAAGKMEMVRVAGGDLVDRLGSGDELGLVAYNNRIEVVRPMADLAEPEGVKSIIRQLTPRGATDLGGGLMAGIGLFGKDHGNGTAKRLLLLTDGLANRGETRPEVLAQWARNAFLDGRRVSTIGLGLDYNERLLTRIAHAGGGEFYYVTKRSELPALFRRELEEGRTVAVKGLTSVTTVWECARLLEMVGYPFTGGDEKARAVKIGDLYAKEKRAILLRFELAAPESAAGDSWLAAIVDLAWKNGQREAQKVSFPLVFDVTYSETEVAESVVEEVRARVIEMDNYVALDEAMSLFRKGEREKALEKIKEAEQRAGEAAASGDSDLLEQTGQLAQAKREIEQKEDERSVAVHNTQLGCYGSRRGGGRRTQVLRGGGTKRSESAVNAKACWLARNQAKDGSWGEGGDRQHVTSLSLLAFLGAGHTEKTSRYKTNVRAAVEWLISRQHADGRIGPAGDLSEEPLGRFRAAYGHAAAALALAEAYGMARVAPTGRAAQKAVDWLEDQHPFTMVDRATANGESITDDDVAGIAWCVMAMKSAMVAGLTVSPDRSKEAVDFLDRHETADGFTFSGRRPGKLDTMVGLLARQFLGWKRDQLYPLGQKVISAEGGLPSWGKDGDSFNWYYAYFGNLVCFQMGGNLWKTWNGTLRDLLIERSRKGPDEVDGSWDPVGTFRGRGRALPTAVGGLCLEVYYRYLPLYR